MDVETLQEAEALFIKDNFEPIYITKEQHGQLYNALAIIETLAYSKEIPERLKENLVAVLDFVWPKILAND